MASHDAQQRRYLDHLQALLRLHPPQPKEGMDGVQIATAAPLVAAVCGRPFSPLEIPGFSPRVTDSFGHSRGAYHGLLVHAWGRARQRGWPAAGLDAWLEDIGRTLAVNLPAAPLPAALGAQLCTQAWHALALCSGASCAGNPRWLEQGRAFFATLLQRVQPRTFMQVTSSDNLEPWWYHELVLLHAATSFALRHREQGWIDFLRRAADYHYAETQPDHATTQPWGINAFLLSPATVFLADQMIHAAVTQGEGRPESVAAVLFADTLDAYDYPAR
jgi:hypothetical protein